MHIAATSTSITDKIFEVETPVLVTITVADHLKKLLFDR